MSEKLEIPRLSRKHYSALEKIFAAEIGNRLPLQSRAKVFKELESGGLVQPYERRFGADRFGEIRVSGWALTDVGRLIFCANC
mgnify:CR=1 FL=1